MRRRLAFFYSMTLTNREGERERERESGARFLRQSVSQPVGKTTRSLTDRRRHRDLRDAYVRGGGGYKKRGWLSVSVRRESDK